MDMWAIACTVYELFSGTILFQGRDNNEMLRLIMDLKGAFPKKMVRRGMFSNLHFAGAPPTRSLKMSSLLSGTCATIHFVLRAK
jgi:serine/threonine protein kinase